MLFEQIRANQRKAVVLILVMALLLLLLGYTLGDSFLGSGEAGLVLAVIAWMVMSLVSYFGGDSIFLSLSGARKIGPDDHPVLYNVVEEMQIASGLPRVPDVYIIDSPALNAFATGRNAESASIAVTAGLLETLDRDELQGVIAHETAHIKNRDILYMMLVGVMMGTIVLLADIGRRWFFWGGGSRRRTSSRGGGNAQAVLMIIALLLMILSPILAQLIYFAASRRKEYLADACGVQFTRYPEGLAGALEKIAKAPSPLQSANRAMAPMYIVNPLKMTGSGPSDLSSTHPPISERIRILRSMAGGAGFGEYEQAFRKVTGRAVGVIPFSALKESQEIPLKQKTTDSSTPLERIRQTTDVLWKLNQFIFIPCACETKLKIPPFYSGKKIICPHCQAEHFVP